MANLNDPFPNDHTQWSDQDDDGFGDNLQGNKGDGCPEVHGTSKFPVLGYADTDGDGWANTHDIFPKDNSQWSDQDDDGFGDNLEGNNGDGCPQVHGTSKFPVLGYADTDGDGWANTHDTFPDDDKEWQDSDGDGIGDNADGCPEVHGTSKYSQC